MVDRGSAVRTSPGMVDELLGRDATAAVVLSGRQALVTGDSLFLTGAARFVEGLQGIGTTPDHVIYLGTALDGSDLPAGTELLLVVLPDALEPGTAGIPGDAMWTGFRDIAAESSTPRIPRCSSRQAPSPTGTPGTRTVPGAALPRMWSPGDGCAVAPQDSSEHYPRTDPAIIVTVVGPDGRLLLGGGGPVDARNYSTLAGFVEPGESLEQAVVREIHEEVGVRVSGCQYLGSQPWPFPASLMLGFTAITADTEATPDGVEVTRARWFSREELQEAVLTGEITISSRLSIARSLIEHWYGGRILDRTGT